MLVEGGAERAIPDEACAQKAASSFNGSLKTCGTPTQLAPIESLIDQFADAFSRSVTVPTTTTTTTTSTTTTTTEPPPLGEHLVVHHHAGHRELRARPDPDRPIRPSRVSSTPTPSARPDRRPRPRLPLHRRRRGHRAPSLIPENATSILNTPRRHQPDGQPRHQPGGLLDGSAGLTQHCVNNPTVECTSDDDCGFHARRLRVRSHLLLRSPGPGRTASRRAAW